jgi:hypothetical protein
MRTETPRYHSKILCLTLVLLLLVPFVFMLLQPAKISARGESYSLESNNRNEFKRWLSGTELNLQTYNSSKVKPLAFRVIGSGGAFGGKNLAIPYDKVDTNNNTLLFMKRVSCTFAKGGNFKDEIYRYVITLAIDRTPSIVTSSRVNASLSIGLYAKSTDGGGSFNLINKSDVGGIPQKCIPGIKNQGVITDALAGNSFMVHKGTVSVVSNKQNPSLKPGAGGGDGGGGADADADSPDEIDCQGGFGFGWIICPIFELGANMTQEVFDRMITPMMSNVPVKTSGPFYSAWQNFRILGNLVLVGAMLLLVYGMIRNGGR